MTIDLDAINLAGFDFWRRPDRPEAFAALRAHRPVSWHDFPDEPEKGMQGFWAITRYDDVVAVSTNPRLFTNVVSTIMSDESEEEAIQNGFFLNMDGPRHFKLRNVVQKTFSPQNIRRMSESAHRHAEQLVLAAKTQGGCDFAKDIAQPFPVEVVCDLLGAPGADRKRLAELSITALTGDVSPEAMMGVGAAFVELNAYGEALAREKRKKPADDIMTLVAQAEIDGRRLSEEECGMFFQILVTAGMETTGTAGGHLMRLFLDNPDQMALWAADPDAIGSTGVEELVRFISPITYMRRTAAEDTEIGGQAITAGDKLVMFYNSANRDETKFVNPESFDVRRNPNPHLGFGGGGRHTCLGSHLARLELPILAKTVFQHLRDIEPAGEPVFIPSRVINGLASLPVQFKAV